MFSHSWCLLSSLQELSFWQYTSRNKKVSHLAVLLLQIAVVVDDEPSALEMRLYRGCASVVEDELSGHILLAIRYSL